MMKVRKSSNARSVYLPKGKSKFSDSNNATTNSELSSSWHSVDSVNSVITTISTTSRCLSGSGGSSVGSRHSLEDDDVRRDDVPRNSLVVFHGKEIHSTPEMTEEEWEAYWYSKEECTQMKKQELEDCKVVLAGEEYAGYIEALTNAYKAKGGAASSALLFHVQQAGPFCVGLEQRLVKANAKDKQKRRQRLTQIASNVATSGEWDRESLDDLLREMCSKISRPAALFALAIGQAQAHA